MIKVSATNLEAYRKYLEERISLDALLDTVLRRSQPNSMMIKGTLFHEMLQTSEPEKFQEYFSQDCIETARSFMNYRSPLFEVKTRKQYQTRRGIVSLTGVADQILGNKVIEIKTRYSPIQYETYSESLQWRVYCDVFDVPEVQYNVFEFKHVSDNDYKACAFFNFFSPKHNHEHVNNWIDSYVDFLYLMGLQNAKEVQL
jgi:hypothetical protein